MTDGGRAGASEPDPRAEHADPRATSSESVRREASADESAGGYKSPEAALGGADAVEKTTYVVGEGTEPGARPHGGYVARGAAGGSNVIAWIVGGVAALIALVYAIGIFT